MMTLDENVKYNNVDRRIGIISKIHGFCDKYNLSKNVGEPVSLIREALITMVLRNEFERVGENADKNKYVKIKISIPSDMIIGYFTPEQIDDIAKLDTRIMIQ